MIVAAGIIRIRVAAGGALHAADFQGGCGPPHMSNGRNDGVRGNWGFQESRNWNSRVGSRSNDPGPWNRDEGIGGPWQGGAGASGGSRGSYRRRHRGGLSRGWQEHYDHTR